MGAVPTAGFSLLGSCSRSVLSWSLKVQQSWAEWPVLPAHFEMDNDRTWGSEPNLNTNGEAGSLAPELRLVSIGRRR